MTKDEKEFRTWLKDNYGIQDYNNYSGTQAEELAIQYAHFKQTGTNTLVMGRKKFEQAVQEIFNSNLTRSDEKKRIADLIFSYP